VGFDVRLLDLSDPKRAETELTRVGADTVGIAKMRDKAAFLTFSARGIRAPGANILKQEMLSLGGEAAVGRGVVNCSIDRTDVLLLGTKKQYRGLARKLRAQPFGLRALGEEIRSAISGLDRSFELGWTGGSLQLSQRPHVMGVLNVTPDSFSDGGDFSEPEAAVDRALQMVEEGADIVDIGGESTRPGAPPAGEEVELARVLPLLDSLAPRLGVPLSIDTYKAGVARLAVRAGASIVNDITGLNGDPDLARVVSEEGCAVVVMHMRGTPRTMQADTRYDDLLGEVFQKLNENVARALEAGISKERIIVDPGIGFGKSPEGSLALLRRLRELKTLGCPILVGMSRKSFIGKTLGIEAPKERLEGSLAAAALAVWNGAHIVRTHDVRETRRAVDLAWAVRGAQGE
jgi:dihydropteroate synthase